MDRDPDIRAMLELNDESAGEFDNDAADESKQNKDTLLDDDFMAQLMQEEQQGDGAETEEFDFDVVSFQSGDCASDLVEQSLP